MCQVLRLYTVTTASVAMQHVKCTHAPGAEQTYSSQQAARQTCQHLSQNADGVMQRILGFNEDQMQDFYYMRRLYLTRRAVLAQQRNTLIAQMNVSSGHLPDPSDSLNDATDFAAKLRQNAVEDYEVYVKVSCAVRRGVSLLALACCQRSYVKWYHDT